MVIKNRKFQPVIIGGDLNAYTIARSFHEAYQVKSLVISKVLWGPSINSKIIDNFICEDLENDQAFVKTLIGIGRKNTNKKLILLGCSDWYVEKILKHKRKLARYYVIPYISINLFNKVVKKDSFYQICEELGVPYPKTFVYDMKEKPKLDFPFSYPIAVKPSDGIMYHHTLFPDKKKGYKFSKQYELESLINNLNNIGFDDKLIIQDFIPGDDCNMFVLTCYSDKQGKVKFYALGNVLLEEHTPGAIGNHAAIINDVQEELFKQAKKILEHVKFKGFANFDIKYDYRDGKYKFFELNARLGRSNYYITASGYNVTRFIVNEYIYHRKIKETIATKEHLYSILPHYVLFKYVQDKDLKNKARRLIKEGKVSHPLFYKGDNKFKRICYIQANLFKQIYKYKKYYHPEVTIKRKEKFVGVLGGVGPLATAYFLKGVIERTEAERDQDHINMIVLQHSTIPDRTDYILGKSEENPVLVLQEDAKKLEEMGALFIVLPCNTAHYFYKSIQDKINIPLINIIEETILSILKETPKIKKVGLLATSGTINSESYQRIMKKYDLECLILTEEDQESVMKIIYDQVKANKKVDLSLLNSIIRNMEKEGTEKIILGCTELSIIYHKYKLESKKIIDSLEVLMEKTIVLSGKKVKDVNCEKN